jgi:hypothetical protein
VLRGCVSPTVMKRPARLTAIGRFVGLLAGYVGVLTWLTWPLAASAGSKLPDTRLACRHDLLHSVWVLAYESHALTTAPSRFADANIYHPAPHALFYGPAALGALPLFAPVFLASGNPVLAINVTFLLGLALTATAMHVVLRRWTGSDLCASVGAATLLANPWMTWDFVPTAPHWAALALLPPIAFTAATPFASWRSAFRLLPLVVLQCLTELVYVAPAVLGPLGVLTTIRLARRETRAAALRMAAVLVLGVLALLPLYRGYVAVRAANPALATQTVWRIAEMSFPHPLGPVLTGQRQGRPFVVTPVTMCLIVTGLGAALWRRSRGAASLTRSGWIQGVLWTVVGAAMSLPPVAIIAGTSHRTPLGWIDLAVPVHQTLRAPSRLGVAGLLGLAILSGVALAEIAAVVGGALRPAAAARLARSAVAVLVFGLILRPYHGTEWPAAHPMLARYPLRSPPTIPSTFLPILRSSGAPMVELPIGPGALATDDHAAAMYRSITHWRPLINGYASYWPAGFPARMAAVARLPDPETLDELARTTGLALIWVHGDRLTPPERAAWAAPPPTEAGRRLVPIASAGLDVLFAVEPPPDGVPG